MSLYRTYRPASFDDVVGQEHVVTTLRRAVEQDKLSHAYLFAGSRGTGKTSVARILARHMLTRNIEDETRKILIHRGIDEGNLVDLVEIDAASNRGIDDVRALIEKIQFSPVVATSKVYIVDEAHMLTKEAFNALLKTLEEPPPYAYFILATTELHKIPATIQSRCQRYLFRQHKEDDIVGRLRHVAEREKIVIDDEALRAIARHVQGGMRDALSLLDQLRSLPAVTLEDVEQRTGESGHRHVERLKEALRANDRAAVLEVIRVLEESAIPFEAFLRLLLADARTELHAAIERKEDSAQALRLLDTLLAAAKDVRGSPIPALAVESHLLALCDDRSGGQSAGRAPSPNTPSAAPTPSPSAPRTSAPSAPSPAHAPTPPSSAPRAEAAPSPTTQAADIPPAPPAPAPSPAGDSPLTLDAVRAAWPEIVKNVDAAAARMSLKNGHVKALTDAGVLITFTSSFHRDKAASPEAARKIEEAFQKVLHKVVPLHCELDAQMQSPPVADAEAVNLAEAAAEIF